MRPTPSTRPLFWSAISLLITLALMSISPSTMRTSASMNPSNPAAKTKTAAVLRKTGASITFRATSNDVGPTESRLYHTTVHESITSSRAFKDAFNLEKKAGRNSPQIIQSSVTATNKENKVADGRGSEETHSAGWGLVSAVVDAYNDHHSLVLRPDDVWQAILTQLSFYVNAHAEELRDSFVDFKGKKTLVIEMVGTLFSVDFGTFAERMVDEQITTNLKDANVTEWLLPAFSTTQPNDRVAASVTIMSTLQSYFEYVVGLMCGIPEVTLEGTPEDWSALREKINRLPMYDLKEKLMTKWHALLAPILDEFVASASGNPDLAFWDTVCSHHGGGSGPSFLSGWITAFASFTHKGKWQGNIPEKHVDDWGNEQTPRWPYLDTDEIPAGAVSVPVLVDDNGIQYDTQMLAGQFAYEMKAAAVDGPGKNGGAAAANDTKKTVVHPRTDWCIAYEGRPKANPHDYKHGQIRSEEF